MTRSLLPLLISALLLSGCAALAPEPTATSVPLTNTATASNTATATKTATATITPTPSETPTPTISPTPTLDFLAGTVNVEMASCRFGPGGAYLLRTTLYEDDLVEILGYMELNENWLFVHNVERPDFNCWISAELLDHHQARERILPINDPHLVLPYTTQPYESLKGVGARRSGNIVTIFWQPFDWLPGDQSYQDKYLVEVWVCQNGEFVFRAYGTNNSQIDVQDEQNCDQPSHGRAFGSDKHGYTGWVQIPWPN
jgi:hypothetical protein